MDTGIEHRLVSAIDQVLSDWEAFPGFKSSTSYIGVRDVEHNRFALLAVSRPNGLQISRALAHLEIKGDKIWIEFDGTEKGIATDLVAAGVPKDRIVLAFYPTEIREMGEFAVA